MSGSRSEEAAFDTWFHSDIRAVTKLMSLLFFVGAAIFSQLSALSREPMLDDRIIGGNDLVKVFDRRMGVNRNDWAVRKLDC